MTRPVAEILEQAQREGWPTSFIDAMANHHLCGNLARNSATEYFDAPNSGECGSPEGCGSAPRREPHPPEPSRKDADERAHP